MAELSEVAKREIRRTLRVQDVGRFIILKTSGKGRLTRSVRNFLFDEGYYLDKVDDRPSECEVSYHNLNPDESW